MKCFVLILSLVALSQSRVISNSAGGQIFGYPSTTGIYSQQYANIPLNQYGSYEQSQIQSLAQQILAQRNQVGQDQVQGTYSQPQILALIEQIFAQNGIQADQIGQLQIQGTYNIPKIVALIEQLLAENGLQGEPQQQIIQSILQNYFETGGSPSIDNLQNQQVGSIPLIYRGYQAEQQANNQIQDFLQRILGQQQFGQAATFRNQGLIYSPRIGQQTGIVVGQNPTLIGGGYPAQQQGGIQYPSQASQQQFLGQQQLGQATPYWNQGYIIRPNIRQQQGFSYSANPIYVY